MSFLGVQTRPRKPFSHRDWLDRVREVELLQGHPFSSHYREVIATLQSLNTLPRLFYVYRPLKPWLESCERHFSNITTDPWENDSRQRFFGTLVYDPALFRKAWEERLALAQSIPGCRIINLAIPDQQKWRVLQDIVGDVKPFPHENRTPPTTLKPYQPHELVA